MTTFAHKKIVEDIKALDRTPTESAAYEEWLRADRHLEYLAANANREELIVYASGPYSFVHSIAVPNDVPALDDPEGLLTWSDNPFTSIASYVSGSGRPGMWIERERERGAAALAAGTDLIFGRTFEGLSAEDATYFELNQEYAHLSGIHWRRERSAYSRFDENGDFADLVSVTPRRKRADEVGLVTFMWPQLEEYLGIAGLVLVRMFDFTLFRSGLYGGWGDGPENVIRPSGEMIYRQKIMNNAAYTRGVQIIRPRDPSIISDQIEARWLTDPTREYAVFVADDWRHKKIIEISTDPAATTNYFDASENDLPYELSPAFFRPEVLSKYKADREKYQIGERDVHARASWSLRGYDVNEAGQVFAYICYLRDLPYSEQLHWKSYNEPPKAGISERAYVNDFKGEFVTFANPRAEMFAILHRWMTRRVGWWNLRDDNLLNHANTPISSSKDEWAEAVMDLSKLVVEGFEVKVLRTRLDVLGQPYAPDERSIALLEKIIFTKNPADGAVALSGLRAVQLIRSKVKGHAGSSEGKAIAEDVLVRHETYRAHFVHLCGQIVDDLQRVEAALGM